MVRPASGLYSPTPDLTYPNIKVSPPPRAGTHRSGTHRSGTHRSGTHRPGDKHIWDRMFRDTFIRDTSSVNMSLQKQRPYKEDLSSTLPRLLLDRGRERRTRFSYLEHGGPEGLRLDALLCHPDGGHCVRCLMYSVTSEGKSDDEPARDLFRIAECLLKKQE